MYIYVFVCISASPSIKCNCFYESDEAKTKEPNKLKRMFEQMKSIENFPNKTINIKSFEVNCQLEK